MNPVHRPTLLDAARAFIHGSARTAAIAILPLAAVAVVKTAKAQAAFNVPSALSSGYGSNATTAPSNYFSSQLASLNNIQGVKEGVTAVFTSNESTTGTNTLLFGYASGTGAVPADTTIPIAYNFTLASTGSLAITSWVWTFSISGSGGSNSTSTIATGGSGGGTFSGTFDYITGATATVSPSYSDTLQVNYGSSSNGDTLTVTMNPSYQGLAVNASAIPEPATNAALLGLAALGFAFFVRRRRRAAA